MEKIIDLISSNAQHAHWFIFFGLLLAGCNIPISIDVVMILTAVLAASFVPENTLILFLSLLLGCLFSAWIAYFIGRHLGEKLSKTKLFSKVLSPQKLEKINKFYSKYGIWTFIVGRFIPFGVRNCIFMTSGMSKVPFRKFMCRDAVGCTVWASTCFTIFYFLGQNFETILSKMKAFNLIIFVAFSVTVITLICYKLRKNKYTKKPTENL
ncbi:MAG: DedA family protein [Chlamydiae bacterium]|nr:DedA family protein [Chlamydiota bacterium]